MLVEQKNELHELQKAEQTNATLFFVVSSGLAIVKRFWFIHTLFVLYFARIAFVAIPESQYFMNDV